MCTQLSVQCSLHHVSSHEQTVSSVLCNCAETFFFFSFFCATYAFSCVHSFPPFFFPLSFFFHFIFFPLPLCNECLWADRETQSRCLRKIFFFFWSESTRFRFLKRINRRLNRCSRLGADERTNDRVISDRWRCAIRQLYITSCSASNPIFLRSEEEGEFIGDSFFFSFTWFLKTNLTGIPMWFWFYS